QLRRICEGAIEDRSAVSRPSKGPVILQANIVPVIAAFGFVSLVASVGPYIAGAILAAVLIGAGIGYTILSRRQADKKKALTLEEAKAHATRAELPPGFISVKPEALTPEEAKQAIAKLSAEISKPLGELGRTRQKALTDRTAAEKYRKLAAGIEAALDEMSRLVERLRAGDEYIPIVTNYLKKKRSDLEKLAVPTEPLQVPHKKPKGPVITQFNLIPGIALLSFISLVASIGPGPAVAILAVGLIGGRATYDITRMVRAGMQKKAPPAVKPAAELTPIERLLRGDVLTSKDAKQAELQKLVKENASVQDVYFRGIHYYFAAENKDLLPERLKEKIIANEIDLRKITPEKALKALYRLSYNWEVPIELVSPVAPAAAPAPWPNKAIETKDLGPWYAWNTRQLVSVVPIIKEVRIAEEGLGSLTPAQIGEKLTAVKDRIAAGESPDDPKNEALLVETLALFSEVSRRTTGMRPFDVQLAATIFEIRGKFVELATGEGKTIVTSLAMAAEALSGKDGTTGNHIFVANDYLARVAARERGAFYASLGIKVAVLQDGLTYIYDPEYVNPDRRKKDLDTLRPVEDRKEAYACNIVIGTVAQFGFDHLRDTLALTGAERVQGPRRRANIDEIDEILIDEAGMPLVISGKSAGSTFIYGIADMLVAKGFLASGADYTVDESKRTVDIKEVGWIKIEKLMQRLSGNPDLKLFNPDESDENYRESAHLRNILAGAIDGAIQAHALFKLGDGYIIKDDKIVLVDEKGRPTPDRMLSKGLQQALQAKHGLTVTPENKEDASIAVQTFILGYDKSTGASGTAASEAVELSKIYKREVVVVPPNTESKRDDHGLVICRSQAAKEAAIITGITLKTEAGEDTVSLQGLAAIHATGRPVLVGTKSVGESETLAEILMKQGFKVSVLNAKNKDEEEAIIKEAGQAGAITIATNMAGRGTDIKLSDEAKALGGLHVVVINGENVRQVGQLRGRAGRQGQAGSSADILSLDDELIRLYGGRERIEKIMDRLGVDT
ncbi:MAG: hypothetical protein PHX20_08045, partial [Candidatus Omnitrophica bacterium]|nr:hypothetical protein [Candidatus Omnitrophota bacterium]